MTRHKVLVTDLLGCDSEVIKTSTPSLEGAVHSQMEQVGPGGEGDITG